MKKGLSFLFAVLFSLLAVLPVMAADEFTVVSVSPVSGKLDAAPGEITLTFSDDVDAATLSGNIILKTEDGVEIKGGTYPVLLQDPGRVVTVKYGALAANTSYVLSVTEGVKSTSGVPVAAVNYQYYTENNMILDLDFSGDEYVVGQPAPMDNGLTYISSGNNSSSADIKVQQAGDDKYLRVQSNVLNKDSKVMFSPQSPFTDGPYVIEIKIRGGSTDASRGSGNAARNVGLLNTNAGPIVLGRLGSGVTLGSGENNNESGYGYSATTGADENGFFHLKYIWQKDQDGYFYFDAYNVGDPTMAPGKCVMPTKKVTTTSGMDITHIYPQNNDQLKDTSDLSMIRIYELRTPELLAADTDGILTDENTATLVFDDDMDAASITSETVYLQNKETQEKVLAELGAYDVDNRSVTLTKQAYLDTNATYEIVCDGVQSALGAQMQSGAVASFQTEKFDVEQTGIEFTNQEGTKITALKGASSVTANITLSNQTDEAKNLLVFAELFNKEGRLKSVQSTPYTLNAIGQTSAPAQITLENISPEEGDVLRVYIWLMESGAFLPVTTMPNELNF